MTTEQRDQLAAMSAASSAFYVAARNSGCHAFIEFTGLMNEYIQLCKAAAENGVDYNDCNVHSGKKLYVPAYSFTYICEKLECIFSDTLDIRQKEDRWTSTCGPSP